MKIRINNVGIIKDSTLELDGLTVITGKNNSGKTTVGKVLYSIVDALSDITQKSEIDKKNYINKQLTKISDSLDILKMPYYMQSGFNSFEAFEAFPAIQMLFKREFENDSAIGISIITLKEMVNNLSDELSRLYKLSLQKDWNVHEPFKSCVEVLRITQFGEEIVNGKKEKNSFNILYTQQKISNALKMGEYILQETIYRVQMDPMLVHYTIESINQTLKVEFSNQIQSLAHPENHSLIKLFDDDEIYCQFSLENNNIIDDSESEKFIIGKIPYQRIFFVDDPFILDSITQSRIMRRRQRYESNSFLNENRIVSHNFKLLSELRSNFSLSVFEQTVVSNELKRIKEKIDAILPGTYEFNSDGEYYVVNNSKLKLSNLATGSKMFSILKMLLEKGCLDDTCMLILDEPEAHLHPEWQNLFAEIVVLLVKELGVKVILTTHSPNFLLALDANMRKYEINDITNFYKTKKISGDEMVEYTCMNNSLEDIYADFSKYLSEMKILRDKYFGALGDEDD